MLTSIRLENFKSFADETIKLAPVTILVGANASGKSNLIEGIRFLHGTALGMPVDDVLDGQSIGGRSPWPGIRGGAKEAVRSTAGTRPWGFTLSTSWTLANHGFSYVLGCAIAPEPHVAYEWIWPAGSETPAFHAEDDSRGLKVDVSYNGQELSTNLADRRLAAAPRSLGPVNELSCLLTGSLRGALFLDLVPSRMRDYAATKRSQHVAVDGDNLSAVLWKLCQDAEEKRGIVDWLSELCAAEVSDLAFIEEPLGGVMLEVVEKDGTRTPARNLSDGTLRFLGQLVALRTSPPGSLVLLEEIENGLHPRRIHLLVEFIEAITKERDIQVIATTHSPLVLLALSDQARRDAVLFARQAEAAGTIARRLGDLPHFNDVVKRHHVDDMFVEGWFERDL